MKCPYQDIGCWYINDESHECEVRNSGAGAICPHKTTNRPENSRTKEQDDGNCSD